MARTRRNEFTAGIFAVTIVLIGVAVVFWLGASDYFTPGGPRVYFYAASSRGPLNLSVDSPVLVNDLAIGKIVAVHSDPQNARTVYEVSMYSEKLVLYRNGTAKVYSGLVGSATLAVTSPGTKDSEQCDREHPIPIAPGDVEALLTSLNAAGDDIKTITTSLATEVDRKNTTSLLFKIHQSADSLTKSLAAASEAIASIKTEVDAAKAATLLFKIHKAIDNVRGILSESRPVIKTTLGNIDAMTADAKPKVSTILKDAGEVVLTLKGIANKDIVEILATLRKANTNILKISEDFAVVSTEVKGLVVVNRENIDTIIDNLGQTADNLKSASKEIRRSPWRLLYKPEKDEIESQGIYDAARAFSSGAAQLDQALAKLAGLAKAYPQGVRKDDPQLQKIREQLKKTFSQFSKAERALWKELQK